MNKCKLSQLIHLERRQSAIRRQSQSADNALTLVYIAYEIDILKAEMALERLRKEQELFESWRQRGSMRVVLRPSLATREGWSPDDAGWGLKIIIGRPILTGDPIRDIWAVRDEAQRLVEIVLTQ